MKRLRRDEARRIAANNRQTAGITQTVERPRRRATLSRLPVKPL
jgi:hypothetical protein